MISILNGLPSLAKGDEAGGWVGRIAKQLDTVRDTLASLEVGKGLDITADAAGRIRITLDEIVAGTAALSNSAFVAEATPDGNKFTVKILGGTAQGIFGGITVFDTDEYENISNGTIFWLEFDPEDEEWSMEWGQTIPQSASHPSSGNPNYFAVIPICRVDSSAPKNIVQYHYGSVYVPVATNVVDVQQTT